MKKLIIALALLIASTSPSYAQFLGGEQYLTLVGGYASGKLKVGSETIDGGGAVLWLDHRTSSTSPWSFAVTFGYTQLDHQTDDTSGVVRRSVGSWPLGAGGKAWFGQSKWQGYAGALLMVYFSSLNVTTEAASESYTALSTSGWGLGIPLGVAFNVSEKVYINAGYTLHWLWDNQALDNDLIHVVGAGLGIQLGG